MQGRKTEWTPEMILKMRTEFPNRFSRDIAYEMSLSMKTVVRKAREMGLEKSQNFFDENRGRMSMLSQESRGKSEKEQFTKLKKVNREAIRPSYNRLYAFANDKKCFVENDYMVGRLTKINKTEMPFECSGHTWYKYARKIKTIELEK